MKKLERFGKYLILDHLVNGGMAKICRARYLGEQADKLVAIKMVQAQYSKEESFKKMFMDEIKVTFGLIHPNIVQTYDYGIADDQLYVAMEYCDGKNLKEYLDALREKKVVFPPEISVHIMTQACQGLHYAHTLTDKLTGKKSNIIHRDISPHNIMLTYDGAVKIIDFGIAKSDNNSEATQAGTIKGKLSYIAPEYLDGASLDPRYDEFAIGVTLWEMLCARKLFKASNDLAVLKKIQECKIPAPSSINPNVPKELDQIVIKALSKNRNDRYENLDELNRALSKFLYSHYPDFNSSDLGGFAKSLFKEQIKKDALAMMEFGKIDISPYISDYKENSESHPGIEKKEMTNTEIKSRAIRENIIDMGFDEDGKRSTEEEDGETKLKLNIAKRKISRSKILEKEKKKNSIDGDDKTAVTFLKDDPSKEYGKKKARPFFRAAIWVFIVSGGLFYLKKMEPEIRTYATQLGLLRQKRLPSSYEAGQAVELESNVGTISFPNYDRKKHKVYINGHKVKLTGASQIELPFSENIVIRVLIEGQEHYISKLALSESFSQGEVIIGETPKAAFAYIYTQSCEIHGTLSFELFGEKRIEILPLSYNLPLALKVVDGEVFPREYQLTYQSDDLSKPKRIIQITMEKEDNAIDLCEAL